MKAALPAYSEVLEKFSLFKRDPELCVAKKKKIMFSDWVRGREVPFCSLQTRGGSKISERGGESDRGKGHASTQLGGMGERCKLPHRGPLCNFHTLKSQNIA